MIDCLQLSVFGGRALVDAVNVAMELQDVANFFLKVRQVKQEIEANRGRQQEQNHESQETQRRAKKENKTDFSGSEMATKRKYNASRTAG